MAVAALAMLAGAGWAGQGEAPLPPFLQALGGSFELTDHTGARRSEVDPDGRHQLLFFGYANCESICTVALPLMADAADLLAERGVAVRPVMVTVDPETDTVAALGPALADFHDDFVGLTGSDAELAATYRLFRIEREVLFHDPAGQPVYAHGSHIYLLDPEGAVLTMLPPILSAERVAEIVTGYAGG